ncbi:MAG: ABC transporter substrate-binding protein [Deltaproteobacteria bacterium]|nr:ABC transporter substrate-binding protein [Deltaproteobacteria bacterium]
MKSKKVLIIPILLTAFISLTLLFWTGPGQAAAPEPKGKLTYAPSTGTFSYRKAIDPHTGVGAEQTTINTLLFDSLIAKDPRGREIPAMAESWTIGPNWAYYEFKLRKGIKFHNGDPFTANDAKFSIERAMREDLMFIWGAELRRHVDRVETMGDYQLRVYLKAPYPAFPVRLFNNLMMVPKNYIEKVGDAGFAAKPVGAGPFQIMDFKHDDYVRVKAVRNHYRKTPHVDEVHFKIAEEPATRLAMLKTGEADMIMLNALHIPEVRKDPNLRIIWSQHTYVTTMVFQDLARPNEPSPFHDERVRKAASLAIDRVGICKNVLNDQTEPWGSFLAPYNSGFDPKRKPDPYNPELAKKLLAEAGYPNGFKTTFTTGSGSKMPFDILTAQLNEVGIKAEFVVLEHGVWRKKHTLGELLGSWAPVGRTMPEVVETWKKLNSAEAKDIPKAAKEYEDLLFKKGFRTPLWSVHVPYAVNKRVESYDPVSGLIFPIRFEYIKLRN